MIVSNFSILKSEFQKLLKSLRTSGSFSRNFSYLFSGRVLTILLSFLVTPVLTRLYTPEAYGYFSVFNAIAMNFMVISCLSYDNALVIIKEERKFYNLFNACLCISLVSASILFIGLYSTLWFPEIFQILNLNLNFSHSFILITTFGSFVYVILNLQANWNMRRRQFKLGASSGFINQLINRITSVSLGIFSGGPTPGLVFGELSGKLVSIGIYSRFNLFTEIRSLIKNTSLSLMKDVVIELKKYPLYILPGRYLDLLIIQVPIFALTYYFGTSILGNYSLAVSILQLPVVLLRNTLSPIILEKVTGLHNNNLEELRGFVKKLLILMILVSAPFFIILIFVSEIIFPFIFGDNWQIAGEMASIIAIYIVIFLIDIFSSHILQVFNFEIRIFRIKLFQFLFATIGLIPGVVLNDYKIMLLGYGILLFLHGAFSIQIALKILNLKVTYYLLALLFMMLIIYIIKEQVFHF